VHSEGRNHRDSVALERAPASSSRTRTGVSGAPQQEHEGPDAQQPCRQAAAHGRAGYFRLPMSFTASFAAVLPTDVIVTRRATDEPNVAVDLTVTLAVMKNAEPLASELVV
jgi:hypothetical protein